MTIEVAPLPGRPTVSHFTEPTLFIQYNSCVRYQTCWEGTEEDESMQIRARNLAMLAVITIAAAQIACQNLPFGQKASADTRGDENAIRQADLDWSKAAAGKDIEKVVSFYAEDGAMYPPNSPISAGLPAIKVAWTGMFNLPGFQVNWVPSRVEVAKSGELGWSTGTYTLMTTMPGTSATNDHGKYVVVWRKQSDGTWKAAADIFNSDLPAGTATTPAPAQTSRLMELPPMK